MNPTLKNIVAVLVGLTAGMVVNFLIIMLSSYVIPLPEGVDPTNAESLKEGIHLFETKHYIMPFLAHALGTFAGAFVAVKLAASHAMKLALIIGVFFLIGGVMTSVDLGTSLTANLVDWILCYIPMAWAGWFLAKK